MASIISTKTSGGGGIAVTGDTSGVLQLASNNGTTAVEIDASGNFAFNSGYGSVATAYGCRAWVNFNGTGTVAIRASGNVSSITDNGTGDYTVNFTTAMPDANYSTCASNIGTTGTVTDTYQFVHSANVAPSTSSIRIKLRRDDGNVFDNNYISVAVFR